MVNHRYKRAVLGITTALVVSACAVPAMAAPITINTDQSISVVSTDSTYVGGLDLEARIITTVEQDQRSPYAKKGIAVADDYLKIHTEPNGDADVVGKLYSGSGCEIEEVKDGWAHITSGDCDGYVEAKYLLTGTDAEAYAEEHKVSELVAKSQSEQMYMYEEPSADAKIVTTVLWDQELTVLGASDDGQWVQVKVGDNTGYIPADSVVLDVKYEEAVSVDEEQTKKESETAETEAETKAAETEASETEAETEKETTAETETKAAETETAETKAAEPEKTQQDKASAASYTDVNETVWATYSVSIRSAASTDADKLDVLVGSYSITRTGVGDNGWSKVDYNGQTGYIKSEYLTTTKPAAASDSTPQTTEKKQETKETVYATAGVNIRAKASADADVIGTLIAGYSITRTSDSNGWSKVDYNGQTGYIKSDYLTTTKPQVTESNQTSSSSNTSSSKSDIEEVKETVYATAGVNIRAKASADADKIGTLAAGGSITRTGKTSSGWSRVDYNGQTGYIKSDYLTTTKPTVTSNTTASSTSSSSSLGQQIADFAVQYVGYPYVYGGNSLTNGVDCSGFTQQVYLHFGYSIPRRASIQATVGTSVAISDLQPGDLVFYGDSEGVGHVVIYIGNGKVVHASTPSKGIIISDLYYRTPMCAKRII